MSLLYSNLVPINIRTKFVLVAEKICEELKIVNPDWLMLTMKAESNINPKEVNKDSGASGLIQFLSSTATDLGTTVEKLRQMNHLEQLPFVKEYLRRRIRERDTPKNAYDLYFLVHYPVAFGKNDESVLYSKGSTAYANNPLDYDKNGNVTVGEIKKFLNNQTPKGYDISQLSQAAANKLISTKAKTYLSIGGVVLIFCLSIYWFNFRGGMRMIREIFN